MPPKLLPLLPLLQHDGSGSSELMMTDNGLDLPLQHILCAALALPGLAAHLVRTGGLLPWLADSAADEAGAGCAGWAVAALKDLADRRVALRRSFDGDAGAVFAAYGHALVQVLAAAVGTNSAAATTSTTTTTAAAAAAAASSGLAAGAAAAAAAASGAVVTVRPTALARLLLLAASTVRAAPTRRAARQLLSVQLTPAMLEQLHSHVPEGHTECAVAWQTLAAAVAAAAAAS